MRLQTRLSARPPAFFSGLALSFSLIALVLALSLCIHREGAASQAQELALNRQRDDLYACVEKAIGTAKPEVIGVPQYVSFYEQVSWFCGQEIQGLDELNEFDVRLEGFSRQRMDDPIILWMVVAITISGVCLAGLQLYAAYRLALKAIGEGVTTNTFPVAATSNLSVERNKVTFSSSVTGLVILVCSLAFFIVYVKWVYTITEVRFDMPSAAGSSAQMTPPRQVGVVTNWKQPTSVAAASTAAIPSPPPPSTTKPYGLDILPPPF
jgi:hypothetical protein